MIFEVMSVLMQKSSPDILSHGYSGEICEAVCNVVPPVIVSCSFGIGLA